MLLDAAQIELLPDAADELMLSPALQAAEAVAKVTCEFVLHGVALKIDPELPLDREEPKTEFDVPPDAVLQKLDPGVVKPVRCSAPATSCFSALRSCGPGALLGVGIRASISCGGLFSWSMGRPETAADNELVLLDAPKIELLAKEPELKLGMVLQAAAAAPNITRELLLHGVALKIDPELLLDGFDPKIEFESTPDAIFPKIDPEAADSETEQGTPVAGPKTECELLVDCVDPDINSELLLDTVNPNIEVELPPALPPVRAAPIVDPAVVVLSSASKTLSSASVPRRAHCPPSDPPMRARISAATRSSSARSSSMVASRKSNSGSGIVARTHPLR